MNALLTPWDTEFGLPPFAQIADADFGPAFDAALTEARANIAAIAGATEAPSEGKEASSASGTGTPAGSVACTRSAGHSESRSSAKGNSYPPGTGCGTS